MSLEVLAAGPNHRPALLGLFETAGCSCYCRWWHFEGDDYSWQQRCATEADANRTEFAAAIDSGNGQANGVVALLGERAVGWLKLSAPAALPKLYGRRVYRTLSCFEGDRNDTLVIGCMLVHPQHRHQGVARALIAAAIKEARAQGASTLEALPRCSTGPLRDDELWMGPATTLARLGFVQVDGPDPYPVMRRTLS